jgi:hypothetical protein
VLLHIKPDDLGFGEPVFGLHLYTWGVLIFLTVFGVAGANLVLIRSLTPATVRFGWPSRLTIGLLGAIVLANTIAVFCEEGLHWTLPDDPQRYELFYDLGWMK